MLVLHLLQRPTLIPPSPLFPPSMPPCDALPHACQGVITSHRALTAQISTLVTAWEWSTSDHILHFLPLHHVHGVVNKLCCGLWAGATVDFVPFDPKDIWRRFADRKAGSVFMAVPTIYAKVRAGGLWASGCGQRGRGHGQCVCICECLCACVCGVCVAHGLHGEWEGGFLLVRVCACFV